MIAYLEGIVVHRGEGMIIVNVGGVGYKVFITPETGKELKKSGDKPIKIFTPHLQVQQCLIFLLFLLFL